MSTNQERVHELFNVARYLAEEDRKALLDKECGEDAELRNEVESLLKFTPTSAPTVKTGTIAIGEEDVVDHRYEAGNRIGEYEIIRELGEGGFGVVAQCSASASGCAEANGCGQCTGKCSDCSEINAGFSCNVSLSGTCS